MWIRNVAEARFTGDLLVGLVTNLYEQQIRRRSKLCELEPHTTKVVELVGAGGIFQNDVSEDQNKYPTELAGN